MNNPRARAVLAAAAVTALAGLGSCGGSTEPAASAFGTPTPSGTPSPSGAPAPSGTPSATPGARTILMQGYAYVPASVTVAPGEVWTLDNRDDTVHNLQTTEPEPVLVGGGVRPGSTASIAMPTAPGTYSAVCFYHSAMRLQITVE